jgi:hypothetical protein
LSELLKTGVALENSVVDLHNHAEKKGPTDRRGYHPKPAILLRVPEPIEDNYARDRLDSAKNQVGEQERIGANETRLPDPQSPGYLQKGTDDPRIL